MKAIDAVSAMEVRRALAAGYRAQGDVPPIVYTADIFDAESLELLAKLRSMRAEKKNGGK